jgi:hypothetical protein
MSRTPGGIFYILLSLFLFLHLPDEFVILVFRRFVSKSMELHFTELVSARTEGLAFGFGRLLWLCLPLRWGEAFLHEWALHRVKRFLGDCGVDDTRGALYYSSHICLLTSSSR